MPDRKHNNTLKPKHKASSSVSMSNKEMRRFPFLPKGFESQSFTIGLRNKLERSAAKNALDLVPKHCERGNYCKSGLCPRCVRRFRGRLLKFLHQNDLHEEQWVLATVRPPSWEVSAGDKRPFTEIIGHQGRLKDIPALKTFLQALRRSWNKECNRDPEYDGFIAFGSIETNFDVLNNVPEKKPFHLHLSVLGLKQEVVKRVLQGCVKRLGLAQTNMPNFNVVDARTDGKTDQRRVTSYAFKQPLVRLSKTDEGERGRKQTPSSAQLVELALNYGVHECPDRLITVGLEYRGDRFRFSRMKSKKKAANVKCSKRDVSRRSRPLKPPEKRRLEMQTGNTA